uniref:uncharacterized protein LOC122606934 n=1 Tax=Erigeron canadensis TaxID=72917 RepID=UPI001CB9BFC7|nr:uncharacterized protein LOC122606934 [Erigeron canadensis]
MFRITISSSHGQISNQFLHKPSSIFFNLFHTPPTSQPTNLQSHIIADYLINSLKFTTQEAITATTKLHHLKSTENPQSVISFLENNNLSQTQIKSIVLSQPQILLKKVDKTLEPKFKLFSDIGLSGSDLVAVIKKDSNLLSRGLHTSIVPTINFLMRLLGSNEKIVKAIKKSHWPFYGKFFRSNVLLLEKYGVGSKDIERVILRNPRLVTQSPIRLEEKLVEVEKEFGISPGSSMFSYGLSALCSMSKLNLTRKFEVFRSFGWCDSDIGVLAKSQPICLTHSEERLSKMLSYFMGELGYTSSWLSTRGNVLMYNLDKRIKPRYQVFKALTEKGVSGKEFHSMVCLSDVDFVKHVVERHKEELPDQLYERFTKKSKPA